MGKITILNETIKNPITFMGKQAGIAYGSDISDDKKSYKRGKQCIMDGHYRLLEFCDVYFILDGYSNRVLRQFMRHVGDLLTCVQASTRYIDYSNEIETVKPKSVENNSENIVIWNKCIKQIKEAINELINNGVDKEDAQMLIPLGATTKVTFKKNMRNITDMSRVRMCNRAYWEFRDLMKDLKQALSDYSPEWKELAELLMYAKCEKTKTCDEKFGCGKYPKKEEE